MTTTPIPASGADQRCASWSRLAHLDPVGTAGGHRGYLLVDVALPWSEDVGQMEGMKGLGSLLAGSGVRLQARAPIGERRVALYRFPDGPGAARMVGADMAIPDGRLVDAVAELLAGGGTPIPAGHREVLLCTHGRRDLCCGSRGAALHLALTDRAAGVSIRRTSHTGGHRFAPTAIILPEATSWAYLDADSLHAILDRSVPFAEVAGLYRGWAGLGSPELQAVERALLADVGWSLGERPRSGAPHPDRGWTLSAVEPDGRVRQWTATVERGRVVPRPPCGGPSEGAVAHDTELVVSDVVEAPSVRSSSAVRSLRP